MQSPKGEVITVTSGAAKQFLNLGFIVVKEEKVNETENNENVENAKTDAESFVEMVKSKPISELTKEEIQKFVKISGRGKDLKGKNMEEARLLVKEIIDESSK